MKAEKTAIKQTLNDAPVAPPTLIDLLVKKRIALIKKIEDIDQSINRSKAAEARAKEVLASE